jgi:hypothetical protein
MAPIASGRFDRSRSLPIHLRELRLRIAQHVVRRDGTRARFGELLEHGGVRLLELLEVRGDHAELSERRSVFGSV